MEKYKCEQCGKDFEANQPILIICEECFYDEKDNEYRRPTKQGGWRMNEVVCMHPMKYREIVVQTAGSYLIKQDKCTLCGKIIKTETK